MAGILVYALHDDEGNFNQNSLGAISGGQAVQMVRAGLEAIYVSGAALSNCVMGLPDVGATTLTVPNESTKTGSGRIRRHGNRTASPTVTATT